MSLRRWIERLISALIFLPAVLCFNIGFPSSSLSSPDGLAYGGARQSRRGLLQHARKDVGPRDRATEATVQLCEAWKLPVTEAIEKSFCSCPDLIDAVLRFQDRCDDGEDDTTLAGWLQSRGRIKTSRLATMVECHPVLLAMALQSTNVATLQQILEALIGLTESQWNRMCHQKGAFPHRWTRSHLRQLIHILRDRLLMTDDQIQKLLVVRPQVINYQIAKWNSMVDYFESELLLSPREIARMILLSPMLVSYSISGHVHPTVDFLHTLGSSERIQRVVSKYPQVLTHSIDRVLRSKLQFLAERLQLARPTDASEIVLKFPPVFWLRPELLDTKVTFLETELELTVVELSYLIGSYPQVLGLSVESNLQPTVACLRESLTLEQLREFVLYQPSLLAYSLESRLRPRLDLLKLHDIAFAYSPPYLMSLSEAKFQEWVEMNVATWSISDL